MEFSKISKEEIKKFVDSNPESEKGLVYFKEGRVKNFVSMGDLIRADFQGIYLYEVEIFIKERGLVAKCKCPSYSQYCEHIIATLYKWLSEVKGGIKPLIDQVDPSEESEEKMFPEIAKEKNFKNILYNVFSKKISEAIRFNGYFIEYGEMFRVMDKLYDIESEILKLPPNLRMHILELFYESLLELYPACDDSSGSMGELMIECLNNIGICINEQKISKKEKKRIVQKNLDLIEKDEVDMMYNYFDLIVDITSTEQDFKFLEEELEKRMVKEKSEYKKNDYKRLLIQIYAKLGRDRKLLKTLEEAAEESKNYYPLVEFWREKENMDKAVELAEKSIREIERFAKNDHDLIDFLEITYKKRKDKKNQLRIMEIQFNLMPCFSMYKKMIKLAANLKKIGALKKRLMKKAEFEVLIEILLFEKLFEEACKETFNLKNSYYSADKIKNKVAKTVLKEFPEKSLKIYAGLVGEHIRKNQKSDY